MSVPINFRAIEPRDLDAKADPALTELNNKIQEIVNAVNGLMGVNGTVKLLNNLDMGNNRIENLGAAELETDALSQTSADPMYSTATQQAAMEAVGTKMLQTTRRLNDGSQQHKISSDLNSQGSIPPSNITGTLSFAPGSNSVLWTWTNIIIQLADLSLVAIRNATLNVTGLAGGTTYFFYPYYDTTQGLLIFVADSVNASGVPPVAFPSANTVAAQTQNGDGFIPLTAAAVQVTTGGASGNATLRTR